MKNILSKWNITPEELKQATDELCAKGIAKGCSQNTSALLAAVELLAAGGVRPLICLDKDTFVEREVSSVQAGAGNEQKRRRKDEIRRKPPTLQG